jgi:hypothetical protein
MSFFGQNTVSKTLDNWGYISNSAKDIVNTCSGVQGGVGTLCGQNFELGNWNVIVRGADC